MEKPVSVYQIQIIILECLEGVLNVNLSLHHLLLLELWCMCVFVISVFPECCRPRRGDSRLSEEHRLLHLRSPAQVPHRFSQGGGAEAGLVVRLYFRFQTRSKKSQQGQEHTSIDVVVWLYSKLSQLLHPPFFFNEFYWHLVWEDDPVPVDDPRSYRLHGNSHAAPWPAFSCLWVSAVWSP